MNTCAESDAGEVTVRTGSGLDSHPPNAPPTTRGLFGRYRIRCILGSGGMATVYLAEIPGAPPKNRFCALKIPSRKYSQRQEFRKMFDLESKVALEINHSHVCRAFESGEFRRSPYLSMELLKGRSLLAIRKTTRSLDATPRHALRVARLIADACDGLQAVHEYGLNQMGSCGLVHHDVSPDNLVLNDDGFVKIIDFGLAQADLHESEAQNDLLRGKVSYTAPELICRKSPSPRSDVWALGVVTWELLVGRPLFHQLTDALTLQAVQEQPILPPSKIVRSVPSSLDAIVLRALSRDPTERFSTALDFGRSLWRFMVSEQEVVQHVELSAWLHTLFPRDRNVFESLGEMKWDGASVTRSWLPEASHWVPVGLTRTRDARESIEEHPRLERAAGSWFEVVNSRISAAAAALARELPRAAKRYATPGTLRKKTVRSPR